MLALIGLTALVGAAVAQFPLTFTGDAERDFVERGPATSDFGTQRFPVVVIPDADTLGNAFLDVGTPPGWLFLQSGWDMKDLRFAYDYTTDQFYMAINCFGVCGDADGDDDASRTSMPLQARGGQDLPRFGSSESCAIAFDVGDDAANSAEPDGSFDFVVGYPAQQADESDNFPCTNGGTNTDFDTACFGLYRFSKAVGVEQLGQRFVYTAGDALLQAAFGFAKDRNPTTSVARPDLEWSVENYNQLRQLAGVPAVDPQGIEPFSMNVAAFCGSFQDDGVGEDTFPNNGVFVRVDWPCFRFDQCDVCGGDDSTCLDCNGVPNGPAVYDQCGVCNGDNARDCSGACVSQGGNAVYDICDICNGDGTQCLDC
jgi:hypothetical protein